MKMKIFVLALFAAIGLAIGCPFSVYAQENGEESTADYQQQFDEFADSLSDELANGIDDDAGQFLEDNNISVKDPKGVNDISIGSVIDRLFSMFSDSVKAPLVMLGKLTAVVLLCAIAGSLAPDSSELAETLRTMVILASAVIMYDTIYSGLQTVVQSAERLNEFMTSYIPVFSSITAVSGSVTASGSYYAMTLIACETVGVIAKSVIMPFLSIVLAIAFVTAINPQLQIGTAAESVKKACQWILGGATSLFVGLLTIQGFTGNAADSLVTRGAKFAASSFIPIIGGSVSEAYSALYSSLGLIRTSVGTIGIIVIAFIVARPLVGIIAMRLVISLAGIVCDIFGQNECAALMKSTNAVLAIGMSVIICFSLLFVISTAVLMMTALNISI